MFLSAPVTPGRAVVLEHGKEDDLVDPARDEEAQVRPPGPLVLGVLAVVDDLHDHELVGIIAGHAIQVVGLEVVHAFEIELMPVVLDSQAAPVDSVGDRLVHLGVDELVAVSLEDNDVLRLDPGGLEAVDDLEHQLARRVGQRVAHRVHLDPDDVAGLEEASPGTHGVVRVGEFLHASINACLDRLAVLHVLLDHPRVADLDDASRIGAGNSPLLICAGLPSAALGSWAET